MKIIPFSDIFRIKFAITDISVIYQTNNWSLCDNSDGRKMNGFLIIDEGECLYRWRGDEARLHKGAMIYLPKGSQHTVRAPERSLNFYRINFTLTDLSDGEEIVFSDTPSLITEGVTRICAEPPYPRAAPSKGFPCSPSSWTSCSTRESAVEVGLRLR